MTITTTISLGLLLGMTAAAQNASNDPMDFYKKEAEICGGMDSIMARKGTWEKSTDNIVFPDKTFPRNHYKNIYARTDSIYSFLKNAIQDLRGFEPMWYRSIRGDAYFPKGPVPYSLQSYYFDYYCNTNMNKILLAGETSNNVYVFINLLNWFLYEADKWDINDDGKIRTIYQLPPKTGKWNDMPIYELKDGPFKQSVRAVIIGRSGKLPWKSITQKQYLTGLKNKWEESVKKYKPGSGFGKAAKGKLKYINDYLAVATKEELDKIAIIDPREGIWGFKGKFGEEEKAGFRLVLGISEKYFDMTLPRHVPQLIELYWTYGPSPTALHFKTQFEENFPLEKLKAMIDK